MKNKKKPTEMGWCCGAPESEQQIIFTFDVRFILQPTLRWNTCTQFNQKAIYF